MQRTNTERSFSVSRYTVKYRYKDQDYTSSAFASGRYNNGGDRPKTNEVKRKNPSFEIIFATVFSVIISLFAFTMLVSVGGFYGNFYYIFSCLAMLYQAWAVSKKTKIDKNETPSVKQAGLIAKLKEHALAPATREELTFTFNLVSKDEKLKKDLKYLLTSAAAFALASVFTWLFFIGLLILSGIAFYFYPIWKNYLKR